MALATPKAPAGRWRRFAKRHRINSGLLFVVPAFAIFLLYLAWPIFSMLGDSLYDWDGISPTKTFVGLGNYVELLTRDVAFRTSTLNNVKWAFIAVTILVVVGFVLAYVLNRRLRLRNVYRTAFFLPTVASQVVIGVIWKFIYDQKGPLNVGLSTVGLDSLTHTWLADPGVTLYAVIFVAMWASIGLFLVVYIAAIQSVPGELFDSSAIDGATAFQQMRYIAAPLTSNTTRALVILGLIAAVNEFGFVFLLSKGGPYHASEVMAYQIYDLAFSTNRTGYADALSTFLVLISVAITIPQLRLIRRQRGRLV